MSLLALLVPILKSKLTCSAPGDVSLMILQDVPGFLVGPEEVLRVDCGLVLATALLNNDHCGMSASIDLQIKPSFSYRLVISTVARRLMRSSLCMTALDSSGVKECVV